MDKNAVLDLLRNYKQLSARAKYLREQVDNTEAYIEELKRTAVEDSIHITANLDGMPRSHGISNPVETLAVQLADGEYPPHIKAEIRHLYAMRQECREVYSSIRCVDIWLGALTERQRFTVEQTLIEGHTWPETEQLFEQQYSYYCTCEGLRKTRKKALEIICRIAE